MDQDATSGIIIIDIPVLRKLEPHDFRDNQGILQCQTLVCLVYAGLEQRCAYGRLVVLVDSTASMSVLYEYRRQAGILLGCRLAPVFVDTVLKLDNSEIADFERERLVQKDRLGACQGSVEECRGTNLTCSSG